MVGEWVESCFCHLRKLLPKSLFAKFFHSKMTHQPIVNLSCSFIWLWFLCSSFRICGHQLLNTKDDGTKLIPVAAEDSGMYNQRPQTSVLEDVEEFGAFDSQGYVPKSAEENTTLFIHWIHCLFIQTQKWEFHCL